MAAIIKDNSWHIPNHLPADLQAFLHISTADYALQELTVPDTLSWRGNTLGLFSLNVAWNLLRSSSAEVNLGILIWNNFVNPRLACFSWRLLHRKTPIDAWVISRGMSMASSCYSCFSYVETDIHLFFSCNLAQQFWSCLISLNGSSPPSPLSATTIWTVIAYNGDAHGRKCAAAIFFHAISILWSLRNDSKHHDRKPSLHKAKLLFLDRMKRMVSTMSILNFKILAHPILVLLGVVAYFVFALFSSSVSGV